MKSRLERAARRIPGWLWMVICAACFAAVGAMVKTLVREHGVHVFWIGFVRFGLGAMFLAGPAVLGAWSLRINNKSVWIFRGLVGSAGVFLAYVGVAYVGVGRGMVLIYLMSLFGTIAGIFVLHERPSPAVFAAVVIGTFGVLFACNARMPHGAEWAALGAALLSGVTLPFVRLLRRTDSNVVAQFSQSAFGCVLLVVPAVMHDAPRDLYVWGLLICMGLLDTAGTLAMTQGLAMVPVARGAALMMLTPVFALVAGTILMHEKLTAIQTSGCAMVLGASLIAVIARGAPQSPDRAQSPALPLDAAPLAPEDVAE